MMTLEEAAEIFIREYRDKPEFKEAAIQSILSAIKDLKHSNTDRKVAEAVATRLFSAE